MLISELILSLNSELAQFGQDAKRAEDRLARHCARHREQAVGFHLIILQDVVARFGDQDTQALLGLYDRLYGVYRQQSKRLKKQADAVDTAEDSQKTAWEVEAQALDDKASRISDLIASYKSDALAANSPLEGSDENTAHTEDIHPSTGEPLSHRMTQHTLFKWRKLSPGKALIALALLPAVWIGYSIYTRPNQAQPAATQILSTETVVQTPAPPETLSGPSLPQLPSSVVHTNANACFTWNNLPPDRMEDAKQLLEDNPLVHQLRAASSTSELWLLLPSNPERVKELTSEFKKIGVYLSAPKDLTWISGKGWLLHANPPEARKNELLAAADRVNGTVVAKPQTALHSLSFSSGSELLIERLKSFAVQNELGTIQKCGGVKN